MRKTILGLASLTSLLVATGTASGGDFLSHAIEDKTHHRILIGSGILTRTLDLTHNVVTTTSVTVEKQALLNRPAREFELTVHFASPNEKPISLKPGEGGKTNPAILSSSPS
jgi:hypothetical protein